MEEIFALILSMFIVAALIPLYIWKRRQDSRSSEREEEPREVPRRETVVRATGARRMRRRPAASGASSSSANVEETLDESDDEGVGGGYYEAKASKKKEKKRQEREAQRQAEDAARESRQTKQDRYSEMRRKKDEEREVQERMLEEEVKARQAREEEAAAMEFEKWKGEFSVDAEGTTEIEGQDRSQDLLSDFVEFIKKHKCVPLEDLAAEFKLRTQVCSAQDYSDTEAQAPPPEMNTCNGIFLSYNFAGREREYPHVKNVSAQSWAFKATAMIVNAGSEELKGWKMFIGFQHREILVSANGAVAADAGDLPVSVGNGTTFTGYPQSDLKTAIDTAGDFTQISATVEITGTLFGVKPSVTPMPRTIKLSNDGYQCPAPKRHGGNMHVCCKKNPKLKTKPVPKTKFLPRQYGDLNMVYDILQTYGGNYLAQVTIDNNNPLGRLDHWNLTWEWMRGEFISTMRGAYTHRKDPSECLYGKAGQFYKDLDFSQIMNCEKKPTIYDLPADRENDDKIGKLPYCCKNGTLLPTQMDPWKSRSIFQLQVYKLPPDMNRTAFYPPQKWKIDGVLNPQYKCGPPIRVDPTPFPDPSGLQATSFAVATWQVVCNITKPKEKAARCCVSFSAYYNDSAIPCNSCACGCNEDQTDTCNANANPMLLPPDALLVPFANRTLKARAWAKQKHRPIPKKLPCPDNCGVSINWHVNSDYNNGWTARVTIFNWKDVPFEDWFTAIDVGKAGLGYENVYSFNGTRIGKNNQTIFFQGLKGLNYLAGQVNGTDPKKDPPVPGKQQSVISFTKKNIRGLNIIGGDGFPKRVFFNGEECALPKHFPKKNAGHKSSFTFLSAIFVATLTFLLITDYFHL